MLIDRLTVKDLQSVLEIEAQEPSAWNVEMVRSELCAGNSIHLAARSSGKVAGWVCGRTVLEEAELLKIAVSRRYRRQGIGTCLLDHLLGLCIAHGAGKLFLEVRSMNRAAVGFYRGYGFVEIGRRKGYYQNPPDDALVMEINKLTKRHEEGSR